MYQQPYQYPYQSYYQPYQYSQPAPTQATRPVPGVSGRVVASPDEITVQEVPTDGTPALFPAQDGSCVYSKHWTPNGTIETVRYVPESQPEQPQSESQMDSIQSQLADICEAVEEIMDRLPRKATRRKVTQDAE